jgi:hypothetical protein
MAVGQKSPVEQLSRFPETRAAYQNICDILEAASVGFPYVLEKDA